MMSKYVAIDLGSSKITAMAVEVLPDGVLKVLGVESKSADDIKYGVVEQVSGAAFKVSEILKLLKNSAKLSDIERVSVSVGAKSMKSIGVSVSHLLGSPKKISDSLISDMHEEAGNKIKREGIAIYDVIPLYYELDGMKSDEPEGLNASQITGYYTVVCGSALVKEQIDRCFERTGIIVESSPIEAESLSAALLDDEKRENGCALIDFGASTTSLSIYHRGALQYLMVVPLGGKNITRDIQELGISEQNAEKLKRVKGNALESKETEPIYIQVPSVESDSEPIKISTKFLATIIEARLDELLLPIINVIDEWSDIIQSGIIITGGASKLRNIDAYLFEKTEIECSFGCHLDWIADDQADKYSALELSQLIGTIVLNHEYRETHPLEAIKKAEKKPKIPKGDFTKKLTSRFLDFFGDKNEMD